MRKIKFKAKTFGDTAIHDGTEVCGSLIVYDWNKDVGIGNEYFIINEHGQFRVKPETIRQCTCRRDKNKKEIYEGDIIKKDGYLFQVKFGEYDNDYSDERHACGIGWYLEYVDNGKYIEESVYDPDEDPKIIAFSPYLSDEYEIVGNIYDNPELKQKEV